MTEKTHTTVDVLRHTKRILVTEGWIKNRPHSAKGHCLIGGISEALNRLLGDAATATIERDKLARAAIQALSQVITRYGFREGTSDLPVFNDASATTYRDVLSVLNEAIARAEVGAS